MYINLKIVLPGYKYTCDLCINIIGPLPAANYDLINRTRTRVIKKYQFTK